jgi:uncharacterized protein YbjT (DUF2867 family)
VVTVTAVHEQYVVTGAFGYSGKYITRKLLERGIAVRTLTNHPARPNPFAGSVAPAPFNFDNPAALAASLSGATVVINTYWIRFEQGALTFDRAVRNVRTLIQAALDAGVRRFVQISITNASADSPLPYFHGKGVLEDSLRHSGLSYAIVRPTVIFGTEDILINNIAWSLRKFPIFLTPGDGQYRLQPVFVEDLAELIVNVAQQDEKTEIDAVGPEIFSFDQLLDLIRRIVGGRARIFHAPAGAALLAASILGRMKADVMLTADEIRGLSADLLVSRNPPTASTRLSEWLTKNADVIGVNYASETARRT